MIKADAKRCHALRAILSNEEAGIDFFNQHPLLNYTLQWFLLLFAYFPLFSFAFSLSYFSLSSFVLVYCNALLFSFVFRYFFFWSDTNEIHSLLSYFVLLYFKAEASHFVAFLPELVS